jgi:YidC/Oxa1 family membrane protein insertase
MQIWNSFVLLLEQILLTFRTWTGSSGLAIILFTIVARIVILPLTLTSIKSSRRIQELQPLLKELQRKYGKDQQRYTEETMKLYREYKINPAGGCLPLLLQFPIFIGVYQAVINLTRIPVSEYGAQRMVEVLGEVGVNVTTMSQSFQQNLLGGGFLWLTDLGKPDQLYILPVLSVVFQLIVQLMATPRVQDPQQKAMMQSMLLLPIVFGYIGFVFPSGAVLYWVMGSILSMIQQVLISGWGSLANYLKFLPADYTGLLPPLNPAAAAAVAAGNVGVVDSQKEPETKLTFWDVLKPITEQSNGTDVGNDNEPRSFKQSLSSDEQRRNLTPGAPRKRRPKR